MMIRICNWVWRALLVLAFAGAAVGKWRGGIGYAPAASVYDRLVAGSFTRHYAAIALEIAVALWLLSGWKLRKAAAVAGGMVVLFSGLIAYELTRANPDPCGCGIREITPGGDPRMQLVTSLIRNGVLLLGCGWLWMFGEESEKKCRMQNAECRKEES